MRTAIKNYLKEKMYLEYITISDKKELKKACICKNIAVTYFNENNTFLMVVLSDNDAGKWFISINKSTFNRRFAKIRNRVIKKFKIKINTSKKKITKQTIDKVIELTNLISNELDMMYKKHIISEKINKIEEDFQ